MFLQSMVIKYFIQTYHMSRSEVHTLSPDVLNDIRQNANSFYDRENLAKVLHYRLRQYRASLEGHELPKDEYIESLQLPKEDVHLSLLASTRLQSFSSKYRTHNLTDKEIVYAVVMMLIHNKKEYDEAQKDFISMMRSRRNYEHVSPYPSSSSSSSDSGT